MKKTEKNKESLWNRLFKRPKVINFVTPVENKLHVVSIFEDESIFVCLGISKERAGILADKVTESFKTEISVISIIEKLSKECTHANELFWVSYLIRIKVEQHENPVNALMHKIFGK